jgi:hypothetical protein
MNGKEISDSEEPVDHGLRDSRAVLRNPIEDVLEAASA